VDRSTHCRLRSHRTATDSDFNPTALPTLQELRIEHQLQLARRFRLVRSGGLTWTALALGTAACVCGGVLLGWSIVDEQLHELKTTTTLLGTGNNSPSGAFYSHLVGGAGPQLLLSDLKGQLDLLALKIMQQDE